MIYIIITTIGSVRQVEQLTEEILEAYGRQEIDIIQVSAPSGSVAMDLASVKGDELTWAPVLTWGQ